MGSEGWNNSLICAAQILLQIFTEAQKCFIHFGGEAQFWFKICCSWKKNMIWTMSSKKFKLSLKVNQPWPSFFLPSLKTCTDPLLKVKTCFVQFRKSLITILGLVARRTNCWAGAKPKLVSANFQFSDVKRKLFRFFEICDSATILQNNLWDYLTSY